MRRCAKRTISAIGGLGAHVFLVAPGAAHGPGSEATASGPGMMLAPGMIAAPGVVTPVHGGGPGYGQMEPGFGMMMEPSNGMMDPRMMHRMMHGMMHGATGPEYGFGYGFGPCAQNTAATGEDLDVDHVRIRMERWLALQGNERLKLGKIEAVDDDTITAEIVTVDDSLVQKLAFDRHTGWAHPIK